MRALPFKQVDVFTDRPFLGNPVAVMVGAEDLDSATMQRIARWTHLSETTFLLRSEVADYRLRIFTPAQELPFAGHPTIGSAHAALESGFIGRNTKFTQECGAGVLSLEVEEGRIFVKGPKANIGDVRKTLPFASKLLRVDVGAVWVVGEVADSKRLASLKPGMESLIAFTDAAMHVRSFAPAHGIAEDPVCGSGNLSVAAYLQATHQLARFGSRYVARQGMQVGRDGRVHVRVDPDGIRIGGQAVTCIDGTLRA